jgi:hypothetical protein
MKPSKIARIGRKLLAAKQPMLIVGAPGVGKSDTIAMLAKEAKADLIVCHPVVDDPTDYKGIPAVSQDDSGRAIAQFLPHTTLRKMIEADKPTLVFFDDLGQAPPAVQASIMQLVLAREINGNKISDEIVFVAATNRRTDKAAVTGLITPLLDRFITVLTMEFDVDDWAKWALENDVPPVLVAFARFRPDLINKFEANRDMKKSPTPRSVAGVGKLLTLGLDDHEILAGAAGEGFSTEFLAFYRTWQDLPDREEVYMNPESTPVPSKPDVLYALMGSLAFGAQPSNFESCVTYLNRCPKEFAVLCVKDALNRNKKLKASKAYVNWASKNASVFGFDS